MTFSTSSMMESFSRYVSPIFPGATFYEDPNNRGEDRPCWFLQHKGSSLEQERNEIYLRRIQWDLTYLEAQSQPNLQQLYLQAAESLDLALKSFPYSDGAETTQIQTSNRQWSIEQNELHYQFEIQVRVSIAKEEVKMQKLEEYAQEVTS